MSESTPVRIYCGAAHEQFPPDDLLRQAVEAEQAGFDGITCSDHFQPWWEGGESGQAWVWLGAAAQATRRVPLGTAVTPVVHRYHPAVVAQAFMTLEVMFPGRLFLGVGSGESLNETPAGMEWPSVGEQVDRLEEALEIIDRLFAGQTVNFDGEHFRTRSAVLHTHAGRRPPIYVSAFGPRAARIAGRYGDGIWTLADPEQAPDLIETYREAAREHGREPGEVILQAMFSWAPEDEQALEGARVWKGAGSPEFYTDDWHDPGAMYRRGEEQISDEDFVEGGLISADPAVHVRKIEQLLELGPTILALNNVSGHDPHAALRVYGEQVLPRVREAAARR